MTQDIENKKMNCVIAKDLSRFGKDWINTGNKAPDKEDWIIVKCRTETLLLK